MNGVNLPLIAYCCELGLPAPPQRHVDTAAWRESFRHLGRCSELAVRAYDGYWRIDDPMPALAFCVEFARRSAPRLFARPVLERRKPPFRRRRIA